MIVFEQLSGEPDEPYHGAFQSEIDFKGLADYTEIYKGQVEEIEKKTEDLKNMEHNIYANVLVILTVFVALFSFLTTNIGLFSRESSSAEFALYNFIMLGGISFLVATLCSTIGTNKFAKWAIWIATIVFFAAAFFLLWKTKIIT
nr:MAG TPA: Lipopolysaccharide export system permease LptF/LptG [Caudoviricetes sp.]